MTDSIPARHTYEGNGGWKDGRLGQAYDLITAVIDEHKMKCYGPILKGVEELDEDLA